MIIRPEKQEDRSRVATLIARTYLSEGAKVIEQTGLLRDMPQFHSELSMVAEEENEVIIYALFTPLKVGDTEKAAALLAPLAIDTSRENLDIPKFLEESLNKVKEQGYRYILLHGEPAAYKQQGFQVAENLGIKDNIGAGKIRLLVKDMSPEEEVNIAGKVDFPDFLK